MEKQSATKNAKKEKKEKLGYELRVFIVRGDDHIRESFGIGVDTLLCRIQEHGSLSAAAKSMGMAYSKAWTILRKMEKYLGFPLVESAVGRGRGSKLTSGGEDFINRYEDFIADLRKAADDYFPRHFGDL